MIILEKYFNGDRIVYRYCTEDIFFDLIQKCDDLDRELPNIYKSVQFVEDKYEFYFTDPDEEVLFLLENKYHLDEVPIKS